MTGLDAARFALLNDVAAAAAVSDVFGHLAPAAAESTTDVLTTTRGRAMLALIAADELGMSLIDALNRVRFTDGQLTFAAATTTTFDNAVRETVTTAQREVRKVKADRPLVPAGFPREGEPFRDLNAGELAYFIEEASKKGGLDAAKDVAWATLSWRIPQADGLELGKLQRWIINPREKQRRQFFADVLTAVEARLKEIGGAE